MKKSPGGLAVFAFLSSLCVIPLPAYAIDYVQPTWPYLLQALVRFKALDLSDDKIVDDYGKVTDCDIYKIFYNDDFKWNKVRGLIRDSARMNMETYPTTFGFEVPLDLDRYDFDQHAYLFSEKTAVKNINMFLLLQAPHVACDGKPAPALPSFYRAVLQDPITVSGLTITQKDGENLLARMKAEGNDGRRIYARFNLTIVYVEPWQKIENADSGAINYGQAKQSDRISVRMDARLDSIDFFEDAAMTKLIEQSKL